MAQMAKLSTAALVALGALAGAAAASDRSDAEALLTTAANDPIARKAGAKAISEGRRALQRAMDARGAGDHEHGAMLERLATEWAGAARDLGRAAAVEREVVEVQKEALEAETKLVRARALLEETVARVGRAKEKLEALEKERATEPGKP